MTKHEELRRLAEKAAAIYHNEEHNWYTVQQLSFGVTIPKNARFIAAASPDVVLALLDRQDRLEALLREASEALKDAFYALNETPRGKETHTVMKYADAAIAAIEKELTP